MGAVTVIPFRGNRSYVYGADILDDGVAATCGAAAHPDVQFSGYRLMMQTTLERVISDAPLASRDWSSIVSVTADGKTRHVGYRPAAQAGEPVRVICEEARHLPGLTIEDHGGVLRRVEGVSSSPIEAAVIAIKAVSLSIFPAEGIKWIFAKADIKALPDDWSEVRVDTPARETAAYVRWNVVIDDQPIGNIIFYRGTAE